MTKANLGVLLPNVKKSTALILAAMILASMALSISRPRVKQADAAGVQCGAAIADLWFGNDESGSVDANEFDDALDFMYQISDSFNYDAVTGVQAGAFAWDTTTNDVVVPITENFADTDDTGLLQTSNVVTDNDTIGIRELYTAKAGGGGTNLTVATQHMADLIDGGNGRRNGVLQVGIILTDATESQLTSDGANWITAANNLRNAGEGNVGIVLVLIAEAADAYLNGSAGPTVDAVVGTDGLAVTVPTYADAASPAQTFIDDTVAAICEKATPNVDMEIEKTVTFNDENNDDVTQAGETLTYGYDVTNTGETELIDIDIAENSGDFTGTGTLPTPAYVSGDEDVDGDGDAPDLDVSSTGTVHFEATYTLTEADIEASGVTNQAEATATDLLGNTGSDLSDDPAVATNTDTDSDGDPDDPTVFSILDQDNVSDSEENAGPNSGDGNDDGIVDSEQSDVTTAINPVLGEYTTTEIGGDCVTVDEVSFYHETDLADTDPDYDYPLGLHGFLVDCTVVGGTVDVTYYWDQEYDTTDWNYRKYIATQNTFVDFDDQITYGTAVVGGNTVTTVAYSIVDGGAYDGDGLVNGQILDPAGPSLLAEATTTTGGAAGAPNTGLQSTSIWSSAAMLVGGFTLAGLTIRSYRKDDL